MLVFKKYKHISLFMNKLLYGKQLADLGTWKDKRAHDYQKGRS
jgi:hypothetical protein